MNAEISAGQVVENYREKGPPLAILAAAAMSVAAGGGLLVLPGIGSHLAGYLLGSVVCGGLVAVFMKADIARRSTREVVYLEVRNLRYLWGGVLLAGIAVCAAHAWWIATELAAW